MPHMLERFYMEQSTLSISIADATGTTQADQAVGLNVSPIFLQILDSLSTRTYIICFSITTEYWRQGHVHDPRR